MTVLPFAAAGSLAATSQRRRSAMHIRSRIVVAGAIILMAASAALSKDGGLPKLDIQKQCQKTQKATDEFTGTKNPDAFNLCVRTEQSAREKLAERWATTSALDKTSCVHPEDWSPSYFEWLGCLDTRDYMRTHAQGSSGSYDRLEAVPNSVLAIRWLNRQCRHMPIAVGRGNCAYRN